jgi:nucleotide-binding universal stress UspA family protein
VGALAWAAHEADLRKAALEIVHVEFARHEALDLFSPDLVMSEKSILEAAVARARDAEPGIEVRGRLCEPPADDALIEASAGAELLVVGSRGLSLFRQIGMGSVSAACAHHARCPVVIVRQSTGA